MTKRLADGNDSTLAVYGAVAARRLQWDNLLWQVPILSFTAQAFLLNVALAPDSSRFARILTAILAAIVSMLCIHLMAKHRQSEVLDAESLMRMEEKLPSDLQQHGRAWRDRREKMPREKGLVHVLVRPLGRAYPVWILGLVGFLIAAIAIVLVTVFAPELIEVDFAGAMRD